MCAAEVRGLLSFSFLDEMSALRSWFSFIFISMFLCFFWGGGGQDVNLKQRLSDMIEKIIVNSRKYEKHPFPNK